MAVKKRRNVANEEERLCRECATSIPLQARKCKECGSFQDARRFLTVSQSSITFFLALLALIAHFSDSIRDYAIEIRDWASGTNFAMTTGLVSIDDEGLTAILSSRRNFVYGVKKATCILYLPLDRMASSPKRRPSDLDSRTSEEPKESIELPWIGPILMSYEVPTPKLFQPYEVALVEFDHYWTGLPGTEIKRLREEPSSTCLFSGIDQNDSIAGSGVVLDLDDLYDFDGIELLSKTTKLDKSSGEEARRVRLILEISKLRREIGETP